MECGLINYKFDDDGDDVWFFYTESAGSLNELQHIGRRGHGKKRKWCLVIDMIWSGEGV